MVSLLGFAYGVAQKKITIDSNGGFSIGNINNNLKQTQDNGLTMG
jgi:hypothetical protein